MTTKHIAASTDNAPSAVRRGVVMVFVLGVLVILAALGTTFVTLQTLEKRIAGSFTDDVRAKLAAQSGIDFAVGQLRAEFAAGPFGGGAGAVPRTYWGDVDDELAAGAVPDPTVPLDQATNPSYAREADADPTNANTTPLLTMVQGTPVGSSMAMDAGTYGSGGDTVTLRVSDTQGLLNVNDGVHEDGLAYRPVTHNMRRILNVLGELPTVDVADLGNRLIDNRPAGGWVTRGAFRSQFTQDEFDRFAPLVTTDAWTDPNVCLPVPLSADAIGEYPTHYRPFQLGGQLYRGSPPVYRRGRGMDWKGVQVVAPLTFCPPSAWTDTSIRAYGVDELNPTWIELTRRAPVNVNAAPRPVLVALLAGLKGHFLLETRKFFPKSTSSARTYAWMFNHYTYSPEFAVTPSSNAYFFSYGYPKTRDESDELGRLYSTLPILAPGDAGPGIAAEVVADEILACRVAGTSANFNYATAWFGGPFRSWRQFEAFCRNLVSIGVLVDTRPIFNDPDPSVADVWGNSSSTFASSIQQRHAAEAIADAMLANFDPNLHLNELNPDENLHRFVDKTDLIVNSAEFIFTSGGTFEIESLARLLRPVVGDDALTAPDNELMARRTAHATVKLFDLYRETTQKQFYEGTAAPLGAPATSNQRTLEIGPEPDNGPAASENEFSGYIALPTIGGYGTPKAPETLQDSPFDGTDALGAKLHGHFSWDDRLHHHVDGATYAVDLSNHAVAGEGVLNFASPGETLPRPYMPGSGAAGQYRLVRGFRLNPAEALPALDARAPLDLRVDGLYSERHSAPGWWLPSTAIRSYGVAAYWVKPMFHPEMASKTRLFMDCSLSPLRYWWGKTDEMPFQFVHYFIGAHDTPSGTASPIEALPVTTYISNFAPASFLFGFNWAGVNTKSLNHEGHPHAPARSEFAAHRWAHVVLSWKRDIGDISTRFDIFVNGQLVGNYTQRPVGHSLAGDKRPPQGGYASRADGTKNSVRLGAPSRLQADPNKIYVPTANPWDGKWVVGSADEPDSPYYGEFSSDATLDEFYLWGEVDANVADSRLSSALGLWQIGRYFVPSAEESRFDSRPLPLTSTIRRLPPATAIAPPPSGGTPVWVAPPAADSVELIGMAWTWKAEAVDPETGEPILLDHQLSPPLEIHPGVEMTILIGGDPASASMTDDGYSPIQAAAGGPLTAAPGDTIQYRATFALPGAGLNTTLLATPILDDVTIYYSTGTRYLKLWIE